MPRGRLITIEGIDGSGKSTLAEDLARKLDAVATREPTSGATGQLIRQATSQRVDDRTVLHLFIADRIEHVRQVIEPALEAGRDVVCDRYAHSTMAYQATLGLGGAIRGMHRPWCPWPDAVLLLDLPAEQAMSRLAQRGQRDGFETLERQTAVRQEYLRLARAEPDIFHILDATLSPDALLGDAWKALRPRVRAPVPTA